MESVKLLCVVGARPNFVKIAPILVALQHADPAVNVCLVHTGQHYDEALAGIFFKNLNIQKPNYQLEIGSGSHAWQTSKIMLEFEPILQQEQPDALLVVGDVNSTLATSLVACQNHVPVVHVEAGLRSFDRTMPEELNRVLTDQMASLHFITEHAAKSNLINEGIHSESIYFVGNVMIDTLIKFRQQAVPAKTTLKALGLGETKDYALLTLHRPSNVDDPKVFEPLMSELGHISHTTPVVFPCHPRTQQRLKLLGFDQKQYPNLKITDPIDYLSMLGLVAHARIVLTDSGGLQEETTALQVPCLTLRKNTERPVTVVHGTNQIAGVNPRTIRKLFDEALNQKFSKTLPMPPLWDGQAAHRMAKILVPWLYQNRRTVLHKQEEVA